MKSFVVTIHPCCEAFTVPITFNSCIYLTGWPYLPIPAHSSRLTQLPVPGILNGSIVFMHRNVLGFLADTSEGQVLTPRVEGCGFTR